MKLAFLKSGTTPLGWFVLLLGQGAYAHVELVFSDGMCFSCVADEGFGPDEYGVRKKRIKFNRNWVFVELPSENEHLIRDKAEAMLGMPYDILSLIAYPQRQLPMLWNVPIIGAGIKDQYICSEAVVEFLKPLLIDEEVDSFMSPADLYKYVLSGKLVTSK